MTSKTTVIQRLAHGVASLGSEIIPNEVVQTAKRCLVDICGVTFAGSSTKSAKMFCDAAVETYAAGPCRILGSSSRLNASGAAFANGTAAHSLDFDDNCYAGIVHGSAVVFPAVLAIAQQRTATGAELLQGFITGLEIEFAVGKALSNSIYDKGWWTTSVLGSIGSAAGVASITGLDPKTTANALALAVVGAGATRAVRGTSAKHYYCGRAAERGIMAVSLAMKGATGPIDVFEDRSGVACVLNGSIFDDTVIDKIGVEFGISDPGVDIKKYPVCYASHAAADATKEIMVTNELCADDVVSVVCNVPPVVASNLTYPDPKTGEEAQFSLEFALAAILRYGDISLGHLNHDIVASTPMQTLIRKIEMRVGDVPEEYKSSNTVCPEWADVELVTQDGSRYRVFSGSPIGSALRPMSEELLYKKFLSCMSFADKSEEVSNFYNRINNIDACENVNFLFD